ncbi:hypothetical protein [Nonomuraea basaltis]|uniref:hypothetical protein n=1 Tax=Nonomuraea basaltis TaxID=2495887 RepID=UPI00110C40DF|nr:hypothetical protein [Nonomuraea basaltis]TMR94248.1 hypothetical protein EJK15_34705 [Nonomuraea basaltis]
MNDLEERLRAAFDARAQTFEASPHAWARVQARRPRGRRARLLVAALPVALLAVFVPVLLNGGLGGITATDPDEVHRQLMRDRTATGEPLTVDNPTEGKPLRIWFAKAKLGYPEVCYLVERAAAEPYGGCSDVPEMRDVWFTGSTLRDGAATALDWGVAAQDVGAVTGVTKSGRKITGTLVTPDGAPYRIWTVTYPAQDAMTMVEYADRKGRSIARTSRDMLSPPLEPAMGAAVELPDGITARPHRTKDGAELSWMRNGAYIGGGLVTMRDAPVIVNVRDDVITGYARADVARIEVSFPGGGTTSLETRPDPWSLGVVLFAGASTQSDQVAGYRALAYDASGKEVWQHEEASAERPDPGTPTIGPVMSLPGTERSGKPTRVWFFKADDGQQTFCASGGASPGERGVMWCAPGGLEDSFPVGSTTSYLPEPGAVIHYGPALDDWEWVEAVLSDGRRVRAEFLRGEGAPLRVWHASVPRDAEVGGYVLKVHGRAARPVPTFDKACGRQDASSEAGRLALPAGITAHLSGSCMAFWEAGKMVPGLPGPVPGRKLSEQFDARWPAYWSHGKRAWYGYAPAGTAKVVLALKRGGTATAEAVPDPWGQGVTLFAALTPKGADFGEGATLTGYGADGKELWTYDR